MSITTLETPRKKESMYQNFQTRYDRDNAFLVAEYLHLRNKMVVTTPLSSLIIH